MPSTREVEPAISPPPALGPPIIGTDPSSAPGIVQPQYKSGSATSPATPISITGTPIIPTSTPPGGVGQIGDPVGFPTFPPTGANTAPVPIPGTPLVGPAVSPAPVPPSVAGQTQPQYKSGSGTTPTAASLFPSFSLAGPSPPIIFANIMQIGPGAPPFTAGTQPIVISTAPAIPQLPWVPGPAGLPVNTTLPSITGTPPYHPNSVVTCSTGTWSNSPTAYHYEWLRNGSPIDGAADANTYTLANADRGEEISCIVTAVNASGVASAEAHPIAAAPSEDDGEARQSTHRSSSPSPRHTPKKKR